MKGIGILNGMVLIINTEINVYNNTDRWNVIKDGFSVSQPLAGFVKKEWWFALDKFQNINLNSDIIDKIAKSGEKVSNEDLLKYTDLQKLIDLQKENINLSGDIAEFNILIGVDKNKEYQYRRVICELGKQNWRLVEKSNIY